MAGMKDFRTAIRAVAIIAFTIGGLLVPYFLAYRFTGTRSVQATEEVQVYRQPWQAGVFSPAAKYGMPIGPSGNTATGASLA